MEHIIAKLLQDFDQGKMSRRQLIQSLALMTTAASAVSAVPSVAAAAGPSLKARSVNHISFDVHDYTKIRDFYVDLFGMRLFDDSPGKQCHLQVGDTYLTPRNRPAGTPTPRVQHIAIGVETFNKKLVDSAMESRGIKVKWGESDSAEGGNAEIHDPEGFTIQIVPYKFVAVPYSKQKRNT